MKRTNIYLDEQDKQDLEVIRQHYRLASDAAAVRLAIHKLAEEVRGHVSDQARRHRQERTTQ